MTDTQAALASARGVESLDGELLKEVRATVEALEKRQAEEAGTS